METDLWADAPEWTNFDYLDKIGTLENNDAHDFITPFAEYDYVEGGDELASKYQRGNLGDPAANQLRPAPPIEFVAQMDKDTINDMGETDDFKIDSIKWVPHRSTAATRGKTGILEDQYTDAKFFPDATSATGPLRNVVDVLITIRPKKATTLYLKAFDVDDPSDRLQQVALIRRMIPTLDMEQKPIRRRTTSRLPAQWRRIYVNCCLCRYYPK